ncbi:conserved hypothetical protein [Candidatus Terasakiella magnetica]|nr:conserved hypothetical protein [Candidatus Terasakiella magnetica]
MTDLSADILEGADQIASFIYGSPKKRSKVYHLADKAKLPVFRMGAIICARKSTILQWIADQEKVA